MIEADETIATDKRTPLGRRLIRFVLRPAPVEFTPANFVTRMEQHAVVYVAVLIAAVCACVVISAPM